MTTTYRDLVTGALRLIGVIGDGEIPTSYQADNAMLSLTEMLDSWNSDGLMIYTQSFHELSLTSQTQTWTIGPGGDIDVTVRPSEIRSASLRQNASSAQPVDLPMAILDASEWLDIRSKNITSAVPRYLYLDGNWPLATLYLWPVPQVNDTKLIVLFNESLATTLTLDDEENLPPAYRQAIRFNLAMLLANEYGREAPPTVQSQAYKSKNIISQNNQQIDRLDYDSALTGWRGNGIYWIGDDQTR